ncbi:PQQ-binding-like beta-propeller repeat protein [Siccirubricoccus sp. KC 17139]|uniref:PQQ-binding-like beta-propeller repeat protein n=1 Tax=Siccirubricoccus soli TaxID=2899147 RepID=A0ABT1DCA9_9PROT|nr:PQQ-binding-like beta-propeller repeat protein [Siccirubricoccus soli]MCO6418575.1 PQQ-binding-like beta-propeller repeat protein [Siccirubricoccus soli]MCP2684710.1 PQQ-binding-like beta-propeller repeat protein [Siccirubricoccus soli]
MRGTTRRAALLGSAGLLAGCETITDTFDNVFGERKRPLPGERRPVLAAERPLGVDEGDVRPIDLPAPEAVAEWPQAGGTISHAPGHPALGTGLRQAWSSSIGSGSGYRRRLVAPPVVAGGTAYASDVYGEVTALDAATGRRRWSFDTRPDRDSDGALGAGLGFAEGTLYVATGMAELLALNPEDGKPRWRVSLPAPARGAPTIAGNRIYVPTTENQLLALSVEDGSRLWTYRGQPTTTMALGLPAPAVMGEIVVAGFGSGELAAIRAGDGRAAWSETLASARGGGLADIAAITALPVIDRNRVFATGLGGITISIDLRSGRRIWEREVASAETPWAAGDALFLVSTGGDLVCFGRDDGRVRWLRSLGRYRDEEKRRDPLTWGPPLLAGGRLLVTNTLGQMVEVNPVDGELIARNRLSAACLQAGAVAGETLYLLTEDANLVAMRPGA